MPPLPPISDAEWDVMNVLWSAGGPLSANDVVEKLAAARETARETLRETSRQTPREPSRDTARDRSPRTIKTLLNRLINKGALAYDLQGKRYLYRPRVARDQCVREETRSFLS